MCGGITARTASVISTSSLTRFSKLPPYSSVRRFATGLKNSCNKNPCAAWNSITSNPALTARLAALAALSQTDSLGLPSAPSFAPRKKPPVSTNLQKKIDDEIDTWCIICQDDATLKCLGCDNDLYCQNCWMEGHRGESAGFEERRHKAVLYSKKKPQAAA